MIHTQPGAYETFGQFDTDSTPGDTDVPAASTTAPRRTTEWKLKHLVCSVRGGSSPGRCETCLSSPPESGWYRAVFHRGGWGVGSDRCGTFCSEACVDAWLDRESDVTLR